MLRSFEMVKCDPFLRISKITNFSSISFLGTSIYGTNSQRTLMNVTWMTATANLIHQAHQPETIQSKNEFEFWRITHENYDLTTFYLFIAKLCHSSYRYEKLNKIQSLLKNLVYLFCVPRNYRNSVRDTFFRQKAHFNIGRLLILIKQFSKSHNRNGDRRWKLRWVLYL